VAIASEEPFDVILMDLKLPDGDGCTFVPRLAAATGGGRARVIAVSAHALAVDQQRALEVGCSAFIEKPIDVATFVDRVEELAAGRG
jgi:CheY-like chemotaxis protein